MRTILLLPLLGVFSFYQSASAATLQEAFQSALQKNETVGLNQVQVVQARERVSQLRGGLYPQVALNATHLVQPEPSDPIARDIFPDKQTTINLSATQVLFRGLREFAGLRQQKDLVRAQEEARNQALLSLYQDVSMAYLTVLNLERDLKNLEVQTKLYEDRVTELQGRARRGESNTNEVLTAQSTEAALKAEAQLSRGQLKMARENFAFVTGLPVDEVLSDPDLAGGKRLSSVDHYLSRLEERYDIKAAREQLAAAEEEVSIAKGAHWPSLDVTGNYYFKRPPGFTEDLTWDVQFNFTLPIFEGGTTQSKVRSAAAKKLEAELTLARLRRQARQEISSYYETFLTRQKQVEALQKSAALAEKNYQVMQRDYRRGLARNIDVQMALTDFRTATRSLDQARFNVQMDLIRLQIASAEIAAPAVKED